MLVYFACVACITHSSCQGVKLGEKNCQNHLTKINAKISMSPEDFAPLKMEHIAVPCLVGTCYKGLKQSEVDGIMLYILSVIIFRRICEMRRPLVRFFCMILVQKRC